MTKQINVYFLLAVPYILFVGLKMPQYATNWSLFDQKFISLTFCKCIFLLCRKQFHGWL